MIHTSDNQLANDGWVISSCRKWSSCAEKFDWWMTNPLTLLYVTRGHVQRDIILVRYLDDHRYYQVVSKPIMIRFSTVHAHVSHLTPILVVPITMTAFTSSMAPSMEKPSITQPFSTGVAAESIQPPYFCAEIAFFLSIHPMRAQNTPLNSILFNVEMLLVSTAAPWLGEPGWQTISCS